MVWPENLPQRGWLVLLFSVLVCTASLCADYTVDPAFAPILGTRAAVDEAVELPDGKVAVRGDFSIAGGAWRASVVRLLPDGSPDPDFHAALPDDASVVMLSSTPGGKLLVVGSHLLPNDPGYCIVCLLTDGSLDPEFEPIRPLYRGVMNYVISIAATPDHIYVLGAYFTQGFEYDAVLERWNYRGVADSSGFHSAVLSGMQVPWTKAVVQVRPDGRLLVGGGCTSVDQTPVPGVAVLNLDGTLDGGWHPTGLPDGDTIAVDQQPDGSVLVCQTVSGNISNGYNPIVSVAKLQSDGGTQPGFSPVSIGSFGPFPVINRICGHAGGGIVEVADYPGNTLVRFTGAGQVDGAFNKKAKGLDMAGMLTPLRSGGVLMQPPWAWKVAREAHSAIWKLQANGERDPGWRAPLERPASVDLIAVREDGMLAVGGNQTLVNGGPRQGTVVFDANGKLSSGFISNTSPTTSEGLPREIQSLCFDRAGRLLASGHPKPLGDSSTGPIIRFGVNGDLDGSFVSGESETTSVRILGVHRNGRLVIAKPEGEIVSYPEHVAELQPDGRFRRDILFGRSEASAQAPGGAILVSGRFWRPREKEEASEFGLFSITPTRTDLRSYAESAFRPSVIAPLSDGKVLAVQPETAGYTVVRFNADGSRDDAFSAAGVANGAVFALTLAPDGGIWMGGAFTSFAGKPRGRFARLHADGSLDETVGNGPGADGQVKAVACLADGRVILGGEFTRVDGVRRTGLAQLLTGSLESRAPLQPSGVLAVRTGDKEARIEWDDVRSETGYRVERQSRGATAWTEVATLPADATSWVDADFAGAKYRVIAINAAGESGPSAPAFAGVAPPPRRVVAEAVSARSVRVAWLSVPQAEEYRVERCVAGGDAWRLAAVVPSAQTEFLDAGLPGETAVRYRIRTRNRTGLSAPSQAARATTLVMPAAPHGFRIASVSHNVVELRWNSRWDDFPVRVERSLDGRTWDAIGERARSVFRDAAVSPGTVYFYRACRYSDTDDSEYSPTLRIATLLAGDYRKWKGVYSGLLSGTDDSAVPFGGAFAMQLSAGGEFTGTLQFRGRKLSFRGAVDSQGTADVGVLESDSPVKRLTIALDPDIGSAQGAAVLASGETAAVEAHRRGTWSASHPYPQRGAYTVLISPKVGQAGAPEGSGYAHVVASPYGTLRMTGALPNNTSFLNSCILPGRSAWPVFIEPAAGSTIYGWANLLHDGYAYGPAPISSSGPIRWVKGETSAPWLQQPFSILMNLSGEPSGLRRGVALSPDIVVPGGAAKTFPLAPNAQTFTLHLSGGGLRRPLTPAYRLHVPLAGDYDVRLAAPGANIVGLVNFRFVQNTCVFSGQAGVGDPTGHAVFRGALLFHARGGDGFFVRGGMSGKAELLPYMPPPGY